MAHKPSEAAQRAAQIAGLRSFETPTLEAVESRRLQLWIMTLALLVSVAVAFVLLTVWHDVPESFWFSPRQMEIGLLGLVALFCTYAIEKELQLRHLTRLLVEERVLIAALTNRVVELNSLLSAAKAMNVVTDLNGVLGTILRSALDLLQGRDGSIMLASHGDELRTVVSSEESLARGARLRFGEGVAGRVAASREPVLVTGVLEDERRGGPYRGEATPPVSSMSVPLIFHGDLLGVLNINASSARTYTEYDLRALSLFGEHAAGAIANAQLLDEQRLLASQNLYQALHDSLTNLPNRVVFMDRVQHALARRREAGHMIAVAFLDLDDFKRINDSLGHGAGDEILIAFAERLRASVRAADTVARFGGDEFVVLVEDVTSVVDAVQAAERITALLWEPFLVGGRQVALRASIGVAVESPAGGRTGAELLRNADLANHVAKRTGKGRIVLFEASMHTEVLDRLDLEADLQRALESGGLDVYYQPIVGLKDRDVHGFEALVRWRHRERGLLTASAFVPLAEQAGILPKIDRWVLAQACAAAQSLGGYWKKPTPPLISVNISPGRLLAPRLLDEIRSVLGDSNHPPERLMLEIAENSIIRDTERIATIVAALKATGVRLALDDFGTGYSSLSHLSNFRVDAVKIDRVFVDGLTREASTGSLVEAIVRLAQSLSVDVIAEGVEHDEQVEALLRIGCTLGQGFGLCVPLASGELIPYLQGAPVSHA